MSKVLLLFASLSSTVVPLQAQLALWLTNSTSCGGQGAWMQASFMPNPIFLGDGNFWITMAGFFNRTGRYQQLMLNATTKTLKENLMWHGEIQGPSIYAKNSTHLDAFTPLPKLSIPFCSIQEGLCEQIIENIFHKPNVSFVLAQGIKYDTIQLLSRLSGAGIFSDAIDEFLMENYHKLSPVTAKFSASYYGEMMGCHQVTIHILNPATDKSPIFPFPTEQVGTKTCHRLTSEFVHDESKLVCLHNGTATAGQCQCTEEYFGPMCEFACQNGGKPKCNPDGDTAFCDCANNFTGIQCLTPPGGSKFFQFLEVKANRNNTGLLVHWKIKQGQCSSILDYVFSVLSIYEMTENNKRVLLGEVELTGSTCASPSYETEFKINETCTHPMYKKKTCQPIRLKPFHLYEIEVSIPNFNSDLQQKCNQLLSTAETKMFQSREDIPLPPSITLYGEGKQLRLDWTVHPQDCTGIISMLHVQLYKNSSIYFQNPFSGNFSCLTNRTFHQMLGSSFPSGYYKAKARIATSAGSGNLNDFSNTLPLNLSHPLLSTGAIIGISAAALFLAGVVITIFIYYWKNIKNREWKDFMAKINKPRNPPIELSRSPRPDPPAIELPSVPDAGTTSGTYVSMSPTTGHESHSPSPSDTTGSTTSTTPGPASPVNEPSGQSSTTTSGQITPIHL